MNDMSPLAASIARGSEFKSIKCLQIVCMHPSSRAQIAICQARLVYVCVRASDERSINTPSSSAKHEIENGGPFFPDMLARTW